MVGFAGPQALMRPTSQRTYSARSSPRRPSFSSMVLIRAWAGRRRLEDHLVGVFIAVVAALAEDGDPLEGDGQAVFLGHDLGHEQAPLQGPGVEQGLGQAVADGRVEPLALDFQGFEFPGHGPEGADRPPLQARPMCRSRKGM